MRKAFLGGSVLLLCAATSQAIELASERFEYPAGPITGQNGGAGFTGSWKSDVGLTTDSGLEVQGFSLTGPSGYFMPTAGNSTKVGLGPVAMFRALTTPLSFDADQDYYISYLGQRSAGIHRFRLYDGNTIQLNVQTTSNGNISVQNMGANTNSTGNQSTANETVLWVIKIAAKSGAESDQVFVSVFNELDVVPAIEPPSYHVTSNAVVKSGNLGKVEFQAATAGITLQADELRIGTTYADVAGGGIYWTGASDDDWSIAGNWNGGVPNAIDATLGFAAPAGTFNVNLDTAQTVGTINFASPTAYDVGGAQPLTMDVSTGSAQINVGRGIHTISAPLTLNDDLRIKLNELAGVSFTGAVSATGKIITQTGRRASQFENLRAAGFLLNGGTATISAKSGANDPSGTSNLGTLTMAAGSVLDLTNNAAVVTTSGTLISEIRQALVDGRLMSTSAGDGVVIGYGDNAVLGKNSFAGESVDNTHTLIMFTWSGDADLDGKVTTTDFNHLAGAFGGAGEWTDGDFNRDGMVTSEDFNALTGNYGKTTPPPAAALGAVVPEPVAASALLLLGLVGRRRK